VTLKDWIEVAKLVGIPLALALGFAYAMIKRFIVTGQELATTEKKCSDDVTALRTEHEKRVAELRRLYEVRFTEAVTVREQRMADLRKDYERQLTDAAAREAEWKDLALQFNKLTGQAATITEAVVTTRGQTGSP
jgi:hypothetical protein